IDEQPFRCGRAGRKRRQQRLDRVYAELAVAGKLVVRERLADWVVARSPSGGNWCDPRRRTRGDKPLVIQKRATVGGVKEPIAKRELLREFPLRKIGRIDVA